MAASIRTCYRARSTFNSVHLLKLKLKNDSLRCVPLYVSSKRDLFVASPAQKLNVKNGNIILPFTSQRCTQRSFLTSIRLHTTQEGVKDEAEDDYHSIIKDTERGKGPADVHEFQAETRKLLDIVAKSLYSEKEVFIRELISNSSDAIEKLRYYQLTGAEVGDQVGPLEIHIATNDDKKTFTIQDTGVGLTKEELIDNLGTIARSGSKAFLDQLSEKASAGDVKSNLIGQFGVGFYSTFMVGDKVDVYTKSFKPGSAAYKWSSDGSGKYEITDAEGVDRGTKIVIHLKGDCYQFAKEEVIKEIVKKYSNFVGVPIFLNGKRANIIQALWTMDPKDVTPDMHEEFYRFIGNVYDKPRYHLHYKTDAPLNIRALFYVPEYKPTMFDMSRETEVGVSLYSRKVLILARANHVLPKWLRFVKGVVDSEDIPLNLSRELLQDSALIRKLRQVLTTRLLKFFSEQAKKDPINYMSFYEDYGLFFREGIVTTGEQEVREDIAKLLRFESSKLEKGQFTSLEEYAQRMKAGERNIYFLSAPSRQLAETSPYFEALKKRDIEVLFLYEPYDELVLMNLGQFDRKNLKSIENELYEDKENTDTVDEKDEKSLKQSEAEDLKVWLKSVLLNKVNNIKITKRLESHPCVITVMEMGSARHFLRTTLADKSQDERLRLLQPTLELNPSHPLVVKLFQLKGSDPELATLLAEQLYDNAMINAGLIDDPRLGMSRLQSLLERAFAKI
ncbi:cytochrome P450 CYP44 [Biomphalaria glabrata]|uniref:Heat shock protein 75 kDa, mitochondrial n=1 Tax=Biomphalaria glabrata TaxID=6526 RepID=A0A9W3B4Z8_BIOGL|nr:heat shock protein 75 kDa, mitochondrial-like [Biomphalaria glabrata]KAI8734183.1 putative cytochrome P450 CYP44 heat shock protein 75 kDa; mitochondrial-like P Metal binding and transport [Biomphalaria glabrata]